MAQHTSGRRSAIDRRTTRHAGYAVSQRLRKLRYIGQARNALCFTISAAAYNLVRIAKLELATA